MKKIFFLFILLLSSALTFGQMRGQQAGQSQSQASMPKFKAENFAGILKYDAENIFKKISIKDNNIKKDFNKPLNVYNKKIDEIIFLNTPKLEKIEREVNLQRENAMASKDRQAMMIVMEEARIKLTPIKKEVIEANKNLNLELSKILSEKQYKKWLKYQKKKEKSLKPKTQMSPNNKSGGQRKGSMGGGGHGKRMGY